MDRVYSQKRTLKRWEFEFRPDKNDYYMELDNLAVCWNVENQVGAYTIDGELTLLLNWDMLDDLMSMTEIY